MSEILSQSEIEALLSSLSGDSDGGGGLSAAAPPPRNGPPPPRQTGGGSSGGMSTFLPPIKAGGRTVAYEVYDFRRPDKLSKDQLRTLQQINETFARLTSSALSAYLRTPVQIDLVALEQVPYEDYLRGINSSVFTLISLPPLSGQAVLEMEFGLVFTMIDRMLGGPGKAISRTNLTDIERPLLRADHRPDVLRPEDRVGGRDAHQPHRRGHRDERAVRPDRPADGRRGHDPVRGAHGRHPPCHEPVHPLPGAQARDGQAERPEVVFRRRRKATPTTRLQLSRQVQDAEVELSVCLGETTVGLGEFVALRPGDVLKLQQPTEEPLTLSVGGVPKFVGRPAMQGKKIVFAVVGRQKDA